MKASQALPRSPSGDVLESVRAQAGPRRVRPGSPPLETGPPVTRRCRGRPCCSARLWIGRRKPPLFWRGARSCCPMSLADRSGAAGRPSGAARRPGLVGDRPRSPSRTRPAPPPRGTRVPRASSRTALPRTDSHALHGSRIAGTVFRDWRRSHGVAVIEGPASRRHAKGWLSGRITAGAQDAQSIQHCLAVWHGSDGRRNRRQLSCNQVWASTMQANAPFRAAS